LVRDNLPADVIRNRDEREFAQTLPSPDTDDMIETGKSFV
jgi:hypothetical protein